jgi:hypothetical protein
MKEDGVGAGFKNSVCLQSGVGYRVLVLVENGRTLFSSRMSGGNNPLAKLLPLSETWRSRDDEPRST